MELILAHWRRLWHCCKFMCSIFNKAIQLFDFIKPNVIRKLAYKVKYICQINGASIMFFRKIKNKIFFKLVGLIVNNMERIDTRKRNAINSSVFKVFWSLSYYLNVTDPLIIPLNFMFILWKGSCQQRI